MPRLLLLLPLLVLLTSCGDDAPPSPATDAPDAPAGALDSTVHFLCFSRLQGFGEAVPCRGDDDFSSLAAASELRDELRAQGDGAWLVCIGDSTVQTVLVARSQASIAAAEARSLAMLDAMAAASVDFYVPSHGDFFLGERRLLEEARARGLTLLLTNVELPGTEGLIDPYAVVDHDGLKLALFGAIAPRSGDKSDPEAVDLKIAKPVRRVPDVAESVLGRGEAHTTVLFSNLSGKQNQSLCDATENVHFIIGSSDTGFAADRAIQRHGTTLMNMRTGGREVGHTTLRIANGSFDLRDLSPLFTLPADVAEMEAAIAGWITQFGTDDPRKLAPLAMPGNEQYFINRFTLVDENKKWIAENTAYTGSAIMHRAAELRRPSPDSPVLAALARQPELMQAAVDGVTRAPPAIVPDTEIPKPDTCVDCHAEQHAFWAASGHARAYDLLVGVGRQNDSSCLLCHAAGWSDADGFDDPRLGAPFGGVTCYNCHFASNSHAQSARMTVEPLYVHNDPAAMMCERCHTPRQAPDFDLEAALPKASCPPIRADDPVIVRTLAEAIRDIDRREAAQTAVLRDAYRKGRAQFALGHIDEGIASMASYARGEESTPQIVVEIVDRIEDAGRSSDAGEVLREALSRLSQDPTLNLRYLQLLVHARDPEVRDPEQVLRRLPLLIPGDSEVDANTLPFRIVEIEALLALGRRHEALARFNEVRKAAPEDERVLALELSVSGKR